MGIAFFILTQGLLQYSKLTPLQLCASPEISEGTYMRKPSKVMIIRDLQEGLWQIVEPRIDSEAVTTDSHERIMRLAIQRFVEEKAKSLSMAELADALDSLEQTAALFLEYLRSKGIVGDPIAVQ